MKLSRSWTGLLRCLPLVLLCSGTATTARADAWQIEDGASTLIVEGDRALALKSAMRMREVQATARWLLGWHDSYRPPRALIFALRANTVRRVFAQDAGQNSAVTDPNVVIGASVALPSLSLVVAPFGSERGVEFTPLQNLYGSLVSAFDEKLKGWPPCVRQGVEAMLSTASFEQGDHLYIDADRFATYDVLTPGAVFGRPLIEEFHILSPADFLDPAAPPSSRVIDMRERAFACIVLSHWYATADAEQRPALEQLFAALGSGRPLADSVPMALGATFPEFTARYQRYAARWRFRPKDFDIRVVLPSLTAPFADPVPVPPERLEAFLRQTCAKLSRCRT